MGNFGNSGACYYAAKYPLLGVASGYTVTKFEVQKDSGYWFACTITSYAYKCSVDGVISTPLSVRLTEANGATITGYSVIQSFTDGVVSDFGSNFGDSAGFEMEKVAHAAYPDDDDDVALAELAKNDGMKLVYPTGYIGNGNVETIEINVEMDVNDKDAMMATA